MFSTSLFESLPVGSHNQASDTGFVILVGNFRIGPRFASSHTVTVHMAQFHTQTRIDSLGTAAVAADTWPTQAKDWRTGSEEVSEGCRGCSGSSARWAACSCTSLWVADSAATAGSETDSSRFAAVSSCWPVSSPGPSASRPGSRRSRPLGPTACSAAAVAASWASCSADRSWSLCAGYFGRVACPGAGERILEFRDSSACWIIMH